MSQISTRQQTLLNKYDDRPSENPEAVQRLENALSLEIEPDSPKALDKEPNDYRDCFNQGNFLVNSGRYEEALPFYDEAVEIKPDYYQAWSNQGAALAKLGRHEEALKSFDKALKSKLDYYVAWYNRGVVLGYLGRYEDAIASYDKAVKIKPYKHEVWVNRGIALDNLRRYQEAIASYDKALEFKPDDPEAWGNRSVPLMYLGRYEEALKSCDKALELNPDEPAWYYNKACYYALQNNVELAIENLQRAINLDEKYHEMAKTDRDFDEIREDVRNILSQSLANDWQGIEKTSGVCGGRACIAGTRIPVWVLVNARRLGYSDADLLDNYPLLSAQDLVNTWSYAEKFAEEIEYDIWENEKED